MTRWPLVLLIVAGSGLWLTRPAAAQQLRSTNGGHFPLSQYTPVGVAGRWSVSSGRVGLPTFQPVRVSVPTTGVVTFYAGAPDRAHEFPAPAQAGLLVGSVYRLKVTGLPEFPGVEFYPSIELLDRLHPPPGKADEFPVDVTLLPDELRWAADGRMVTKVVYLEQPDRVQTQHLQGGPRVLDLEPAQNALAEADVLGRPIAIVRIGGRTPDPYRPDPLFFGPGGPIQPSSARVAPYETTQRRPLTTPLGQLDP